VSAPQDLPEVTAGQLRALRIAARHSPRTPRSERVEIHPLGRQYVQELADKGLLARAWFTSPRARRAGWEVTPLAVELLRAHWLGERQPRPLSSDGLTYHASGSAG
jgi:hypothetical protein